MVIATGVSYRRLGIPGLERLVGAGVFYVWVSSEAFAMAGEDVFVAGAGNSAAQAALHLAKYARRVTVVSRHASLAETMSAYLITLIEAVPTIEVMLDSEVVDGAATSGCARSWWSTAARASGGPTRRAPSSS